MTIALVYFFDISDDLKGFPCCESSHRNVIFGSGARRQRIDAGRMTQRFVFRNFKLKKGEVLQFISTYLKMTVNLQVCKTFLEDFLIK